MHQLYLDVDNAINSNVDGIGGNGLTNDLSTNAVGLELVHCSIEFVISHFDDDAAFFGEENIQNRVAVTVNVHIQTTVGGKGHLQNTGHQATIADVMSSSDHIVLDQVLHNIESFLQVVGIIDVWALIAELTQHLGKRRTAKSVLSTAAQIDVNQTAVVNFQFGGNLSVQMG